MRLKEKWERPNYRAPMAFFFFSWIMSDKTCACRCGVQCKHTDYHAYLSQRRKQAVICALMTGEALSAGGRGWNEQRRCADGDGWGMGGEILNKIALVVFFFFWKLTAGVKRGDTLSLGLIGTKANHSLSSRLIFAVRFMWEWPHPLIFPKVATQSLCWRSALYWMDGARKPMM